jgi:AraC-like DNA-binding protein
MLLFPLKNHCVLVTDDPEVSREFLSPVWEKHRTVLRDRRFSVRWHQADLRRCSLAYVDHPCALDAACEGPLSDSFRLLLPMAGRIDNRINGRPAEATPSSAVLHAPAQDLKLAIQPFRLMLLGLDGAFVRHALRRRFASLPPFEQWAADLPLDAPAAASLNSFCHWLAHELDRPESLLRTDRRAIDSLERALLAFFIEVLAAQYPTMQSAPEDLANRQIALIEAWIEANLGEPIGVEELAAVADVSTRSVQIAFRRLRGCTPVEFIRIRRLGRARQMLLEPTPQTTVTTVALDCGFFHFGRFSQQYRAQFGEKPSQTLARARG